MNYAWESYTGISARNQAKSNLRPAKQIRFVLMSNIHTFALTNPQSILYLWQARGERGSVIAKRTITKEA
jgi:hypothetical protein